jgi:hypothetical protein
MYNFYEIRCKATHRIEYMDLFLADEKPDEIFKKNPVSKAFAGRLDLYINIAKEQFESYEKATTFLHQKRMDYKLLKEANEEARTEATQPKKSSPKKKAE